MRIGLSVLLLVGVVGCGAPKSTSTPPTPPPSAETATTASTQAPAAVEKVVNVAAPAETASAPAAASTISAELKMAQETVQAGKSVEIWTRQLASPNTDELLDALGNIRAAGPKAKYAVPRLKELAKHVDADVAQAAKEALQAVGE